MRPQVKPSVEPKTFNVNSVDDFPSLPRSSNKLQQLHWAKQQSPTQQHTTHERAGFNFSSPANNDLFSYEELSSLMFDMVTELENYKSKAHQFKVIAQLACKYLYNNVK